MLDRNVSREIGKRNFLVPHRDVGRKRLIDDRQVCRYRKDARFIDFNRDFDRISGRNPAVDIHVGDRDFGYLPVPCRNEILTFDYVDLQDLGSAAGLKRYCGSILTDSPSGQVAPLVYQMFYDWFAGSIFGGDDNAQGL